MRNDVSRLPRRRERQEDLLNQFGLSHIRKTKANRVSGGERRRLEIARSLITEPKLIMLDEPFAGIDPKTVAEIQVQIRALAEVHHIGILLTDHNVRETLEVTDRSYLIHEGRVVAYGDRKQILNNPDARRFYLGERFDAGHLLDPAPPPKSLTPEPPRPSPAIEPEAKPETPAEAPATAPEAPPQAIRPKPPGPPKTVKAVPHFRPIHQKPAPPSDEDDDMEPGIMA